MVLYGSALSYAVLVSYSSCHLILFGQLLLLRHSICCAWFWFGSVEVLRVVLITVTLKEGRSQGEGRSLGKGHNQWAGFRGLRLSPFFVVFSHFREISGR